MPTYNKFNTANTRLVTDVNTSTDTFKIMLSNTAPVATNSAIADIAEIASGNGYTAGGFTVGVTPTTSGSSCNLVSDGNIVVTATGGAIPDFQYAVLVDTTVDALISWWDRGSPAQLTNDGDNTTIEIPTNLVVIA